MEGKEIFELSILQWVLIVLCVAFIGFSKAGLPSVVILVVTVFMFIFPAKESIGILLPLLIMGDLFAILYYRKHVVWKYLISLIPWVLIGIIVGYLVLNHISNLHLRQTTGIIVLGMVVLQLWRQRLGEKFNILLPKSRTFTEFIGVMAGFATMVGNAAGGVMAIYLLIKNLSKQEFLGTVTWFFY